MADKVVAKNSDVKFTPHEEGQYVAQCVDVIDLGEAVVSFPGTPDYLAKKCALVFRTGEKNPETGHYVDVSQEFTVSMGEKANLRKFLEQWRGKAYTNDQANEGVPVDKLCGQPALLTVGHKESKKGRTYAVIVSAVPVPKQMRDNLSDYLGEYKRDAWWADKKKENATAAAKLRADAGVRPTEPEDEDQSLDMGDDDDLPF